MLSIDSFIFVQVLLVVLEENKVVSVPVSVVFSVESKDKVV